MPVYQRIILLGIFRWNVGPRFTKELTIKSFSPIEWCTMQCNDTTPFVLNNFNSIRVTFLYLFQFIDSIEFILTLLNMVLSLTFFSKKKKNSSPEFSPRRIMALQCLLGCYRFSVYCKQLLIANNFIPRFANHKLYYNDLYLEALFTGKSKCARELMIILRKFLAARNIWDGKIFTNS